MIIATNAEGMLSKCWFEEAIGLMVLKIRGKYHKSS